MENRYTKQRATTDRCPPRPATTRNYRKTITYNATTTTTAGGRRVVDLAIPAAVPVAWRRRARDSREPASASRRLCVRHDVLVVLMAYPQNFKRVCFVSFFFFFYLDIEPCGNN